jgi:cytoskeletal protein CcmA (bactofilin family)
VNTSRNDLKGAEQVRSGSSVAAGIRVRGEISGNEDLLVDGSVEGPIHLGNGQLIVSATGKVVGDVEATELVILGSVKGDVKSRERLEIKSGGTLVGDVLTARILVEDGAHFKGSIEIERKETARTSEAPQGRYAATATSSMKK